MLSAAAVEKMSAVQIRDAIREYHHHIFHLLRSEKELEQALEECPDDRDFMLAIVENKEIIALKQETIEMMEQRLKDIDFAFCREELAASRQGRQYPDYNDISQSSGGPQLDPDEDEDRIVSAQTIERVVTFELAESESNCPASTSNELVENPELSGDHIHDNSRATADEGVFL